MTVKGKNIKSSCGRTTRSSCHNYSVTHAQSITRRDRTVPLRERRWTKTGAPQRGTRRAKRR